MPLPLAQSQRSSAVPPMCCLSSIQIAALLKRRSCSNSIREGRVGVPASLFSPRHGRKRGCALFFPDASSENPGNSRLLRPRAERSRLRLTRIQTQVQVGSSGHRKRERFCPSLRRRTERESGQFLAAPSAVSAVKTAPNPNTNTGPKSPCAKVQRCCSRAARPSRSRVSQQPVAPF
jgi:hypothetical protein